MKQVMLFVLVAFTVACAANQKACAQFSASSFGTDWIVVQYDMSGKPFHCWKLHDTAVDSSEGGNVDWQDRNNGHLVHLTGWENRVQVVKGDFDGAAKLIGVNSNKCSNGVYPSDESK